MRGHSMDEGRTKVDVKYAKDIDTVEHESHYNQEASGRGDHQPLASSRVR